jgi:oxygen-dependent protoporphyrinogen oxidase
LKVVPHVAGPYPARRGTDPAAVGEPQRRPVLQNADFRMEYRKVMKTPLHSGSAKVIVIGAGLAGLVAAHRLQACGIAVRVLEASGHVGGRMRSESLGGHVVDLGAQFLSSEYRLILSLAEALGLGEQIVETSRCSAIVRDGVARRLRSDRPLDALGLLGWSATARFAWRSAPLRRRQRGLSLAAYADWAEFDDETVAAWCAREFDSRVGEYLFEPMLAGFYFQTPENSSRALGAALTAFGIRSARTLTFAEGMGVLPQALARHLDVTLDAPVRRIDLHADRVEIHGDAGTWSADRVILAVPAPLARELHAAVGEPEAQALLATPYSASINVACVTRAGFRLPPALATAYGLLIPRRERDVIAAVGIETNKGRPASGQGQLFNLMFSDEAAGRFMDRPDDEVIAAALQALARDIPGLPEAMAVARVHRWPLAEPLSPVGRARTVCAYRARCAQTPPRLVLAGDYLSMPFTEGAAESGLWAAGIVAAASHGHRGC